ncbi:hypothetical protein ACTHS9_01660 [Bacillus mycoides]|uniref:hypothetical protein n=1 Tax=Bacillus mycoides TaxID=1405 RepID=UPI003F7C30B0
MGCLTSLKDCKPKIGDPVGTLEDKFNEFKKLNIKSVSEFLAKIGNDIEHLPKDLQKAMDDAGEEFGRIGVRFEDILMEGLLGVKKDAEEATPPEELAQNRALEIAGKYKKRPNSDEDKCWKVVQGSLIAIGSMTEGPVGEYMVEEKNATSLAKWACAETYK